MTKREAKQIACVVVALTVDSFVGAGGVDDWVDGDEEDADRLREALDEIVVEMGRRGKVPERVAEEYPFFQEGGISKFIEEG